MLLFQYVNESIDDDHTKNPNPLHPHQRFFNFTILTEYKKSTDL